MKKLFFVVLIISCGGSAWCKDVVKLHGNIRHPLADSVNVSYTFTSIKYEPIEHRLKLSNGGNFSLEFPVQDDYTAVSIVNGNQQTELFVQPGADLTVSIDGDNFDSSVHYEGTGKEVANFMAKLAVDKHTINDFSMQAQMLCSKDVPDMKLL